MKKIEDCPLENQADGQPTLGTITNSSTPPALAAI